MERKWLWSSQAHPFHYFSDEPIMNEYSNEYKLAFDVQKDMTVADKVSDTNICLI
jgi:hypothetical protein